MGESQPICVCLPANLYTYLRVYLPACLPSICLPQVSPSVFLFVCLCVFLSLSVFLSVCVFFCLSTYLSLPTCITFYLITHLPVNLPIFLPALPSTEAPFIYLSLYLLSYTHLRTYLYNIPLCLYARCCYTPNNS